MSAKLGSLYSGLKGSVKKGWSTYFKGVSAGGEEFTSRLSKTAELPRFRHGTLKEVISTVTPGELMLLYLGGGDPVSREF